MVFTLNFPLASPVILHQYTTSLSGIWTTVHGGVVNAPKILCTHMRDCNFNSPSQKDKTTFQRGGSGSIRTTCFMPQCLWIPGKILESKAESDPT